MRRLVPALIAGFVAGSSMQALAQESAQDSAARGAAIAERWCATCHLVGPDQQQASAAAPSFASIARRSTKRFDWLMAFLAEPHPTMPEMSLSRRQIQDLGAYLETLRE